MSRQQFSSILPGQSGSVDIIIDDARAEAALRGLALTLAERACFHGQGEAIAGELYGIADRLAVGDSVHRTARGWIWREAGPVEAWRPASVAAEAEAVEPAPAPPRRRRFWPLFLPPILIGMAAGIAVSNLLRAAMAGG